MRVGLPAAARRAKAGTGPGRGVTLLRAARFGGQALVRLSRFGGRALLRPWRYVGHFCGQALVRPSRYVGRFCGQAFLTVLLVAVAPLARADSLQQLREFLTQTNSARGDFSQKAAKQPGGKAAASSARQATEGTFAFARPGKFRWVTSKPYQQTIVSDGSKLYLYDPDLNQVTVKTLKGSIPASPASILFGSNDFERDFQVRNDGERGGVQWILATPRSQDSSFDKIRIGFRDGLPVAMELADSFGQTTELSFSGLQRNPKIDPAQFHFDPPKGADVLEDQ
jgi:outer membrane lipoprotein carrier protein